MRRLILAFLIGLTSIAAHAGGRGGHVTTFDPAWYGGAANVSCLTTSQAGICNIGYNATCNGIDSDETALQAFRTAAALANPARAVLLIPAGSNCLFSGDDFICQGVQNCIVWGYGAHVNNISFGSGSVDSEPTHAALVQTFNAGDTFVTFVTAANASNYSTGMWIALGCITHQLGGFPPNISRFNYRVVTSITGTTTKVANLSSPVDISCKSTYPANFSGTLYGGPATIWPMTSDWNLNAEFHGITAGSADLVWQPLFRGRTIYMIDNTILGVSSSAPTAADSLTIINHFDRTFEADKMVNNLYIQGGYLSTNLFFQTASINHATIVGLRAAQCNGTTTNTTYINTICGDGVSGGIFVGPQVSAAGRTVTVDGSTIYAVGVNGSAVSQLELDVTALSYSTGTISVDKSSEPGNETFFGLFDVNAKMQLAYHNSFGDVCSPNYVFTITDLSENVSNLFATTGSWTQDGTPIATPAALPTLTCPSSHPVFYRAFPAATITQKFSGPADVTVYAAPP